MSVYKREVCRILNLRMFDEMKNTARYVTRLDKTWCPQSHAEFAVLRTECFTAGNIGNKAFKLAAVLENARPGDRILSFGGAWSNHLHALAFLCYQRGIDCVGVIREGESTDNQLQRSLMRYGMQLHFVSRDEYRRRDNANYRIALMHRLNCTIQIPEGGSTVPAVAGCAGLGTVIRNSGYRPDIVVLPVGTGATMAGVVNGTDSAVQVVGVPVIRDDKVHANIETWVGDRRQRWSLTRPASPGYGKVNTHLLQFMVEFHRVTGIILDPIYTAKVFTYCFSPEFTAGLSQRARVLLVHTGGLLGNFGFLRQFRALSRPDAEVFLDALQRFCSCHVPLDGEGAADGTKLASRGPV